MTTLLHRALAGLAAVTIALVPSTLDAQEIVDAGVRQALGIADSAQMASLVQQLELTPAQETRLDQLAAQFERQYQPLLQEARRMMAELEELQAAGRMDADALVALSERYSETVLALLPATQQFLRDVNAILTPAQQAKFQQMLGGGLIQP
ncbi:MAG: Spy/CpxP family protein refolding chaperone [Gemmatimonadales bacterium]|jgi:Spy/CpxP family protein refolding chaperone